MMFSSLGNLRDGRRSNIHHIPPTSPSDFRLFLVMKQAFDGQRFDTTEEIRVAVTSYYKNLDRTHYALSIQKLVTSYEKRIEHYGDHVEK